jgi:hypothetical protein
MAWPFGAENLNVKIYYFVCNKKGFFIYSTATAAAADAFWEIIFIFILLWLPHLKVESPNVNVKKNEINITSKAHIKE